MVLDHGSRSCRIYSSWGLADFVPGLQLVVQLFAKVRTLDDHGQGKPSALLYQAHDVVVHLSLIHI